MPNSLLRFPSKYLVEAKSFFTTTQYILLLQQNELKKFSMEKDNKMVSVETFPWELLLDVQVSQRAPTEFAIDILPPISQNMRHKERVQLMQSGNKSNTCAQLVLHCAERDKLVAELRHQIHMKNFGGKPITQITCRYQTELCEDQQSAQQQPRVFSRLNVQDASAAQSVRKRQICKAKLYPTAVHMLIDRQSGGQDSLQRAESQDIHLIHHQTVNRRSAVGEILPSQNAMGSLLVSGIQGDALDTHTMLGSRLIMGGSGDEEDEAARSLFKTNANHNYLTSRPFQIHPTTQGGFGQEELRAEQELDLYNNQLEQVHGNDEYIGFGDDRQDDGNPGGGDGAIGMLGHGGNITTFGANYGRNANPKHKDKYSEHAIYLNELAQVLCQESYIVSLVKENQEIEQVIFKDEESEAAFLDQLSSCYLDLMKRPLQVRKLPPSQSLRSVVDFLNWPGDDHAASGIGDGEKSCFEVDVQLVLNSKVTLPDYSIHLDQQNIFLVNSLIGKPTKQMPLVCLKVLKVVDDDPNCNLRLAFDRNVQMNVKAATYVDRERLISCILTMRGLAMSDQRGIACLDNLKILHNRSVDSSHKIQAYSPIEDSQGNFSQSLTKDYESGLIRKLSELMSNEVQTMQLDNVIDEILLNATFCYITQVPEAFVRAIMAYLNRCFAQYLEYEEQSADLIDVFMEKGTLAIPPEARVDFLGARLNTKSQAEGGTQQQSMMKGRLLFEAERHLESLKALREAYEQTIRYLNVLKSLLNSRVFMQEMANQEGTLQLLTLLLISKSPIIAQLAAQVIKAACHHFSERESRIEKANKRVLIRGKRQDSSSSSAQSQAQLHQSLNALTTGLGKNRVRNGHFFEAIFEYLRYFERLYDERKFVRSLHLTSINLILSSVLQERQSSTAKEDLSAFAAMVSKSDYVTDERASNKPIYQLFDKFCLLDREFFDIQHMFTMMLSMALDHFFEEEDSHCLRDLQSYILTYSIQFIWHLYLLMTSKISHQRTLSIRLLARLLHSNQESHDLLLRILPRTLFLKVKANRQSIESLQWNFPQWVEFFTQIVPRNFNSATEQWNNETREELTGKLLAAKRQFIEMKQLNSETITNAERRELMLPIHEFSQGKLVMSRWKNLKWNYREFEVKYECLASEYLVGRYFLAKLLLLTPSEKADDLDHPQLTMQIVEPALFWNELLMQFMASYDVKEQTMIVMTLCVLYRQHYDNIAEMKTIPYWLKLIQHPEFSHVHFLLLQLLHVSLSVRNDLAKANMQLLIKAKGFNVLHNCMNLVFKDLRQAESAAPLIQGPLDAPISLQLEDQFSESARVRESFARSGPEPWQELTETDTKDLMDRSQSRWLQSSQKQSESSRVNFTDSHQLSRYFKQNSLNVCKGILALRIIDKVFTSMQFQYHLPMPTNSEYMLQKHALATLAQMTMLQNPHLTREVLVFIEQHLNNHFTLYKLKHSGLIEYLILALDTRNGERALQLLLKIQEVCITFNGQLDFAKFNPHDLQMIREDKDAVFVQQGDERPLTDMSGILNELDIRLRGPAQPRDPDAPLFDDVYNENKTGGKRLPPVLESIFLRYLPTPFIKFLLERGLNEFLSVYRMDSYRHAILIWNRDQRQILEQQIRQTAHTFLGELMDFAQDPERCSQPTEIPRYEESVQSVINYPEIEAEVRCGRYYLSVWTEQAKLDPRAFFQIPQNEEEEFHIKMKAELRSCIDQDRFADGQKIITLLKSCRLALKKFKTKRIQSLSEIKTILVHAAAQEGDIASAEDGTQEAGRSKALMQKKMILFTGIRIISMAIHEDRVNREEILSMDGVRMISDIISHILAVNGKGDAALSLSAAGGGGPAQAAAAQAEAAGAQRQAEDDQIPTLQSPSREANAEMGGVGASRATSEKAAATGDEDKGHDSSGISDLSEGTGAADECSIDRIDAKTLNLCVESITLLVNEDIRAFMEFPLEQRICIFRQMSMLLDLSFGLFPLLEQRKLKPFILPQPASAQDGADQRDGAQQDGPAATLQQQLADAQLDRRGSLNPILYSSAQSQQSIGFCGVQISFSQPEDAPRRPVLAAAVARAPQVPAKARGGKSPDYDYQSRSLMSIIQESKRKSPEGRPDAYSVCLIFNITSSIFRLMKSVAIYPLAHPELIASGLFWRTIQHCFFDLTEKLYRRSAILKNILKDCTYSLKVLVTFVDKYTKCRPEEQQRFYALAANHTESEIIRNFHECIKKLFTAKILEKLFIPFVITRDLKLECEEPGSNEFLRLFSTQQLQSPELVWNEETRSEMQAKLRSQISSMTRQKRRLPVESAFCTEIKDFEYTVNRTELRIQGIFVKYFNEQCRQGILGTFSKGKLAKFAEQIIEKLEEFAEQPHEHAKNVRELVEAFKNLVVSLNLVIKSELDFEHYFETLCNLISLHVDSGQKEDSWEINEVEKRRLFELSSHALEIFRTLVQRRLQVPQIVYQQPARVDGYGRSSTRLSYRSSGQQGTPVMIDAQGQVLPAAQQAEQMHHLQHGNYLLKCQPFFRLLVRIMYQREIQAVPFKEDVIPMVHEMIGIPDFVVHLFIDRGLIMFLLNLIFDQGYASVITKQMRGTLTDQVLKIDRVMQSMDRGNLLAFSDRQSYGVVKAFIPPSFFAEIKEQMWRMRTHQNELLQLQMQFLDNFDADYFENALVKWDRTLREQSQSRVRDFCERILNNEPILDLRSLDQIVNMELEKEERIMEVILRNYNQNPAVFVNTKLNMFITEVASQLFGVSQQIYALRQDDTEGLLKATKLQRLSESPESMTNTQRQYKYLCHQAQLQLTALLLSIEQLLYNEYNPNLLQTRQDEKLDAQSRLTAQLIQRTTDIRQVEEKVFRFFNMWLQYPVFLDDEISEHIRITFLQALFLVIDVPTSMQYFKKTEVPLDFLSKMIARVQREQGQDARIIEDSLILLVTQKMLRVDLQYTCPQLALKDTLDQLVRIAITKRPLQRYIKQILYLISQNTHYSTNVIEVLERNNGNRQDLDRLRGQSNADFFNQVWRAKPSSASHARTYYELSENHTINRALYQGQLDKLPILSPDSVKKIKYGFLPDDLREFIESSQHNNTSMSGAAPLQHSADMIRQVTQQPSAQNMSNLLIAEAHPEEEKGDEEEETKAGGGHAGGLLADFYKSGGDSDENNDHDPVNQLLPNMHQHQDDDDDGF